MTETKTFRNPMVSNGASYAAWLIRVKEFEASERFARDEWEMVVTLTKKPKFVTGDRVNVSSTSDNYNNGTVVYVYGTKAWVVWDHSPQAVRMFEFKDLRHV